MAGLAPTPSRLGGAHAKAALLITCGLLAAPAVAAAQLPTVQLPAKGDTASGSGLGDPGPGPGPFPFSFNASSGREGETPQGTFSFGGNGSSWSALSGRVTCLHVTGNHVVVGGVVESSVGTNGVQFSATDNGATGDTVSLFGLGDLGLSTSCRTATQTPFEHPLLEGGVVVRDAVVNTDTTPPVLTLPAPITVDATEPAGARVTFSATATDDRDPLPTVSCEPVSGSLFPIGATTVTCVARDAAGNAASGMFTVTVRGGCEQITALAHKAIDGARLPPAVAEQLKAALAPVLGRCATTPTRLTCAALDGFSLVLRAVSGSLISSALARELLADVARIKSALACQQGPQ
jgi:HYR domain